MTSLEMVLLNPGAPVTPTKTNYPQQAWGDVNSTMLSKSICKQLKDCRKEVSEKAVGNIIKEHAHANLGWVAQTIPNFVKGCIELCWLMCTQDPPVVLGSEADVGSVFDGNLYKPYTNSGTIVSYNVWAPLLLYKDGPLLVKGIVQPIKVPRDAKSAGNPKPRRPVVANRLKSDFEKTYISPYAPKRTQHKATEDRSPPGNLTVYSNYGSHQGPYETTTQRTYHQDIVRNSSEPYRFEYKGREYVFMNDHTYPIKEYQQIYGTTRGVSDL